MLVAFTGAGISVASGLPTFDGSYRDVPVRDILERQFFFRHTTFFYNFYREVLMKWCDAEPNSAHGAIARTGCPVVTQNIDGLHQKAGSTNIIELHGNLRELLCEGCAKSIPSRYAMEGEGIKGVPVCPYCGGILKPNIVLFGEDLPNFSEAWQIMRKATSVLVVGTSLMVQPAAGLVEMSRARGAKIIIVNDRADIEVPKVLAAEA